MSTALDTAYVALTTQGVKITARALRSEAGCSTAAAVEYLKTIRTDATETIPSAPIEQLTAALGPLWAAAYSAAASQLHDAHEAELAAYRDSERASLEAVDAANADANTAEATVKQLTREVEHLTQTLEDTQKRLARAESEARKERANAAAAADRAARAEATADTLENIINNQTKQLQ